MDLEMTLFYEKKNEKNFHIEIFFSVCIIGNVQIIFAAWEILYYVSFHFPKIVFLIASYIPIPHKIEFGKKNVKSVSLAAQLIMYKVLLISHKN